MMTSTSPNQKLSFEDLKAKLKQLQMSIQQQTKENIGECDSHSFVTPSCTQASGSGTLTRTSDLTDRNTSNSLHFADRSSTATDKQYADSTQFHKQSLNLHSQSQGPHKPDSIHDLMTPSSLLPTGCVVKRKTGWLDQRSTNNTICPLETSKSVASVEYEHHTGDASTQKQLPSHDLCQSGNTHGVLRSLSAQPFGLSSDQSTDVTNMDVSGNVFISEHTTMSFEVEDHRARMKKIEAGGSHPEEWKAYIDFLKTMPCFCEGDDVHYQPLSEAYSRAFSGILNNRDHRNEASVRLIMDFVCFSREYHEWDTVETILDEARGHIQNYAVIIVACAEVKIFKGDHEKAMTILTKALAKGKAQPKELLIRAIKSAESGQAKLLSDQEWKVPMIFGRQGNPDTWNSDFKIPHSATGFVSSAKDPGNVSSDDMSTTDIPQVTHPPSASKHALNHYYSVPEMRSSALKNPLSKLMMSNLKAIGMPMRVRQSAQQHATHNSEEEDDMHRKNSVNPIHDSSGYHCKKTDSTEKLTAMQTEIMVQKEVSQNTGLHVATGDEHKVISEHGNRFTASQIEMATDPGKMFYADVSASDLPQLTHPPSASKQALHHFHSVPEMRSCALKKSLFLTSKTKVFGMPANVRPQHAVHMLSSEKEDDTDLLNSIKPLNTMFTSGRLASLASSGYQSDMTIPTEELTPAQDERKLRKEVSQTAGPSSTTTDEHKALSKHTQPPTPAQHPPASVGPAAWVAPVMSTPSCKGPQTAPAVMQTPSGEPLKSVTVNGEQYCILKKAGRGGSAQVYVVLDASTELKALKVVDLEGAGREVIEGFRNEISLLQRLQYCDSVIKMYNFELNEKQQCLYLVLEYGETDLSGFFEKRAKQKQGLDPNLIKFYWAEMLRAVNALHKEGIIHSDLKPANFLLVRGNLKLIDFGIANSLQQDKTSMFKDSRVGTPSYMSPEAIMAASDEGDEDSADEKENNQPHYKVGVRSDVWSLGCILYTMVYGRTPFQSIKNSMAKLQAITNPAYKISFPLVPDADLMDVLKKCLTREMKLRPTTTQLLAHPYLTQHKETHRLQEMLAAHLTQGSPRTTNAVNRVMDLLQAAEKQKD